jgi:glycosidase
MNPPSSPTVFHKASKPFVHGSSLDTVSVLLLTSATQNVYSVTVIWGDPFENDNTGTWKTKRTEMKSSGSDGIFRYWRAEVKPQYRRLRYFFEINYGGQAFQIFEKGVFEGMRRVETDDTFALPYLFWVDDLSPPAWTTSVIWYQIFPERFHNGDPSRNPVGALEWGSHPPERENFFGGDIVGMTEKLSYLSDLGISGLYLTPIFHAPSNHKYDTLDYFNIDPHFGTNSDFKSFVDKSHERGIKVMLDAVMNHCGINHEFFKDVIKKGRDSEYWDWFHITEDPANENGLGIAYETFAFEPKMPKLNTRNPAVRDYLTSVGRYWIDEFNIDAWRLDVANEIDHKFWRHFREKIEHKKGHSPSVKGSHSADRDQRVFILGEVWHDALPWLDGSQFHSVMNYPLYSAIIKFLAKDQINASAFKKEITRILHLYPVQIMSVLFNIIGSHDTPRAATAAGENMSKLKLMFLFQFAFPGVPSIYYGDELGMTGEHDPGCRACMNWNPSEEQKDMQSFVKNLIANRKREIAFGSPHFMFLDSERIRPIKRKKDEQHEEEEDLTSEVVAFKKTSKLNLEPSLDEGDLLFVINNDPSELTLRFHRSLLTSGPLPLTLSPLSFCTSSSSLPSPLRLPLDVSIEPFGFAVYRVDKSSL